MKRIISLTLVVLFALTAFVGCGEKEFNYKTSDLSEYVTLGEYLGLSVEVEDRALTDEDIQTGIDELLTENAETVEITDRAVADGDTVDIDYVGKKDGVAFSGGTAEGASLVIGSNSYIDGFEDGLVGVMPGQTVDLNLTFPDPYQNNPDLAGAAVVFTVTVNHIDTTVKPEWNDEFVKTLTKEEYKTTAEYLEVLKVTWAAEKKAEVESKKMQDVWTAVLANAKVLQYPEEKVEMYRTQLSEYYESYASQLGVDLDTLITYMGSTRTEFDSEMDSYAHSLVAEELVFHSIAKKENIQIGDEEYTEGLNALAEYYGVTVEELTAQISEEEIKDGLLLDKIRVYLTESAVEVPATKTAE